MNLERQLAANKVEATDAAYEYLEDPDSMLADDFDITEFTNAMFKKDIAGWAVNLQLKNSYGAAKKILDTL